MNSKEVYSLGKEAGFECAKFCKKETGETHLEEPIYPGDNQFVAEKLGCSTNGIDAKLEFNQELIKALWNGFSAGVRQFNEQSTLFFIEWKISGQWERAHLGDLNEFSSEEEARKAVLARTQLGSEWFDMIYRVVDDQKREYWRYE